MTYCAIEIDGQKLKDAIAKRKISITSVSERLGRHRSYLTHSCHRGRLPSTIILRLGQIYGIRREEYVKDYLGKPDNTQTPISSSCDPVAFEIISKDIAAIRSYIVDIENILKLMEGENAKLV